MLFAIAHTKRQPSKIEGASYVSNKEKHNDYLWLHPYVAKKRFINLYSTGKFD